MLRNIDTEKALGWIVDCLRSIGSPDEGPITKPTRMWWRQGVFVSLLEPGAKAFRDLIGLIERHGRINDEQRVKDVFSRGYIEAKAQELVGQLVVKASEADVDASKLETTEIREAWKRWLSGWDLPSGVTTHYTVVENLSLAGPVQLGTVILTPCNETTSDALLTEAGLPPRSETALTDGEEQLRRWIIRDFPTEPGYALARASVTGAEPLRAREIFRDRVGEVLHTLSFFRRFLWPTTGRVVIDLRGNVPSTGDVFLTLTEDLRWDMSHERATLPFDLTSKRLKIARAIGLSTVSEMLAKPEDQRTALEASCINAIAWISRGLQDNVPDSRFLKLCVGMESLLLTRVDEVKGTTIAERVAYLLAEAPAVRRDVAKQVKDIYAVRSDIAHDGRSSKLAEQLGPAQFFTTEAILQFIRLMSEQGWNSKDDFITWCNDLKWA